MLNEPITANKTQIAVFHFTHQQFTEQTLEGAVNEWLDNQTDGVKLHDVLFQVVPSRDIPLYSVVIVHSKHQP